MVQTQFQLDQHVFLKASGLRGNGCLPYPHSSEIYRQLSVISFLCSVVFHQMNEKNLGVCFAPSLFHLCGTKENPSSPKRQKRTPMNKASKELTDNLVGFTVGGKVFSLRWGKGFIMVIELSGVQFGLKSYA